MFDKLDAYNLVANLIPGAALIYALHYTGFPTPTPKDIGAFLLVSFVAGVTINRLGSLIVDPILRRTKFLNEKNYSAFIGVEKQDSKLETVVANSGLYRTFFTAGIAYLLLITIDRARLAWSIPSKALFLIFVILALPVFLFALRKEDGYIRDRIKKLHDDEV